MFSKLLNASVFILSLICLSCDEKIDDPTPTPPTTVSPSIVGTWKFQSAVGSATVASKKVDLASDLELTDKAGTTQTFKKTVAWVFDENGKGTQDGVAFTYKIQDKTITITKANKIFTLNFSITNNQLDITETETGIKSILDDYNALLPTTNAVTTYNRTQSYKSLKDILATNGTPGCLVKTVTTLSGDTKDVREYTYNDENKVIAITIKSTYLPTNNERIILYRYEEERSNLGSDTKPYAKEIYNNFSSTKFYCDKNGRVNRSENFTLTTDKFPSMIALSEYGTNTCKINSSYYESDTGISMNIFYQNEFEYLNGNLSKYYTSNTDRPRYLSEEITAWTPEVRKTKITFLFNYGTPSFTDFQKNYPTKKINNNFFGNKISEYNYTYTFDSKGYLLTEKIVSSLNQTISTSTYEYFACK